MEVSIAISELFNVVTGIIPIGALHLLRQQSKIQALERKNQPLRYPVLRRAAAIDSPQLLSTKA
jgi:hypothetical protein